MDRGSSPLALTAYAPQQTRQVAQQTAAQQAHDAQRHTAYLRWWQQALRHIQAAVPRGSWQPCRRQSRRSSRRTKRRPALPWRRVSGWKWTRSSRRGMGCHRSRRGGRGSRLGATAPVGWMTTAYVEDEHDRRAAGRTMARCFPQRRHEHGTPGDVRCVRGTRMTRLVPLGGDRPHGA